MRVAGARRGEHEGRLCDLCHLAQPSGDVLERTLSGTSRALATCSGPLQRRQAYMRRVRNLRRSMMSMTMSRCSAHRHGRASRATPNVRF